MRLGDLVNKTKKGIIRHIKVIHAMMCARYSVAQDVRRSSHESKSKLKGNLLFNIVAGYLLPLNIILSNGA